MNQKLFIAAGLVIGLPLIALWAFIAFQPIQVLPRLGFAPGFSLMDQNGRQFTSDQLHGRIVLYNFSYTHCGQLCQPAQAQLLHLQERLPSVESASGIPVQLTTITLDSQRDTPATLRAYAARSSARPTHWLFATTEDQAYLTQILRDGFAIRYTQTPDGAIDFDPWKMVLVDGWGIVRKRYHYALPSVDELMRDMENVASEAKNSKGALRFAYEAAHLLGCYAP